MLTREDIREMAQELARCSTPTATQAMDKFARYIAADARRPLRIGVDVNLRDEMLPIAQELRRERYRREGRWTPAHGRKWSGMRQQAFMIAVMDHAQGVLDAHS